MQVYNDELYHYGKLGMRWGHRKKQLTNGGAPKEKKYKLKFKKHKAAKITATALAGIGGYKITNRFLLNHVDMSDGLRVATSLLAGNIGSSIVSNRLQDNY